MNLCLVRRDGSVHPHVLRFWLPTWNRVGTQQIVTKWMLTVRLVGRVFVEWQPKLKKCAFVMRHNPIHKLTSWNPFLCRAVVDIWGAEKRKTWSLPTGSCRETGETAASRSMYNIAWYGARHTQFTSGEHSEEELFFTGVWGCVHGRMNWDKRK